MRLLVIAMLGAAALNARSAVLGETNIALMAADAWGSERVRAVAVYGRLTVEHRGTRDWWSQPDLPVMPGAIAEVEAVVTFDPGPGGEVGVGFVRRDAKGLAVEWTHPYRARRDAATRAILRARAKISPRMAAGCRRASMAPALGPS